MKLCLACNYENPDTVTSCEQCQSSLDFSTNINETVVAEKQRTTFSKGDYIGDRYEVVSELGRGGMGVVYRVKDTNLGNRETALKMIHPELVANPEARKRFEDEVMLCLDLSHPSIIRVYNLESSGDLHYFTMEYIAGRSLAEIIEERRENKKIPPFTLEEIKAVMEPLLKGISYAHQHTIHRDLKPDNIMITGDFPDISIKILDFGIARTMSTSRFTQTAQGMGTAYYMAPEQAKGAKHVDERADIYSIGMIFYEMLTGELAMGRFPLPSELSADLQAGWDDLILKTLDLSPERRFKSIGELKASFQEVVSGRAEQKKQVEKAAQGKKQQEQEVKQQEDDKQEQLKDLHFHAKLAFDEKNWEKAIEFYTQILHLDVSDLRASRMKNEAEEKWLKLNSCLEEAKLAAKKNNFDQAKQHLDMGLKLAPADTKKDIRNRLSQNESARKAYIEKVAREKAEEKRRQEDAAAERKKKIDERKRQAEEKQLRDEEKKHIEEQRRKEEAAKEAARKRNLQVAMVFGVICLGCVGSYYGLKDKVNMVEGGRKSSTQHSSSSALSTSGVSNESFAEPTTGMEFVYVKGGCYQMGDTFGDGYSDEKPVHEVCVDGFYMGRYEVTQGEYQKITGSNPSNFKKGDNYPVEQVSWNDTQSFIGKLNSRSGKTFRLPTEAEWEYAAREKGKRVRFGTGKDTIGPDEANFNGTAEYKKSYSRVGVYRKQITAAGSFSSNALGLYDMSGNVWEWCSDWYDKNYYSSSSRNSPQGSSSGSYRVFRGGSWGSYPRNVRAADRNRSKPGYRYNDLGFRLVLSEGSR